MRRRPNCDATGNGHALNCPLDVDDVDRELCRACAARAARWPSPAPVPRPLRTGRRCRRAPGPRAAWRKTRHAARCDAARAALMAVAAEARHPLAPWVDYWELSNRLGRGAAGRARRLLRALDAAATSRTGCATTGCSSSASAATGPTFAREFPRFRMNDDREVTCYALLTEHLAGDATYATPRAPPGSRSATPTTAARCWRRRCSRRASSTPTTSGASCGWRPSTTAPRAAQSRRRAARPGVAAAVDRGHSTTRRATSRARPPPAHARNAELAALALMPHGRATTPRRPPASSTSLAARAAAPTSPAWAWAQVGQAGGAEAAARGAELRSAAPSRLARQPRRALDRRAAGWHCAPRCAAAATLAAGAATRSKRMSAAEQRDPTWVYWKARALPASAGRWRGRRRAPRAGHALLMHRRRRCTSTASSPPKTWASRSRCRARPRRSTAAERAARVKHPGWTARCC